MTTETLLLFTKSDLVENPADLQQAFLQGEGSKPPIAGSERPQNWLVSLKTGDGMAEFLAGLVWVVRKR